MAPRLMSFSPDVGVTQYFDEFLTSVWVSVDEPAGFWRWLSTVRGRFTGPAIATSSSQFC